MSARAEAPAVPLQRARFVFEAVGTRGDIEPLLLVAARLRALGHECALIAPLAFRVHPGIQQNAVLLHLHQPRARANILVWVQICDVHQLIKPRMK